MPYTFREFDSESFSLGTRKRVCGFVYALVFSESRTLPVSLLKRRTGWRGLVLTVPALFFSWLVHGDSAHFLDSDRMSKNTGLFLFWPSPLPPIPKVALPPPPPSIKLYRAWYAYAYDKGIWLGARCWSPIAVQSSLVEMTTVLLLVQSPSGSAAWWLNRQLMGLLRLALIMSSFTPSAAGLLLFS